MSEDGAPPEEPGPTPGPAPGLSPDLVDHAPAHEPRRVLRVVILAGVAAIVAAIVLVVMVKASRKHAEPVVGRGDGGAAVRAPGGPRVPGQPGTGIHLAGFVVDGAGLPVAGAEISVELERGVVDRALASAPRDAGVGRDAGAFAMINDAGVPIAIAPPTGADGRFLLDGLEPGRYRLRVIGTGLLAAELRMVPVPSDELRIVVARQVAIEGTVTDGGKPVATAIVAIRGDAIGGTIETKTDSKGAFAVPNLPEGRYQVYAYQAALAARAVRVGRLGAGPFPPVELRLEAGTIVVGRVIDREEGVGLIAAVELRPVGDDQAPRYARTADDGVFRIEGIPNGRWIADAFAPGYVSPGGVELEAGRGIPELVLARGAAIEGRVLDGDGRPVEGAAVRALTAGQNPIEISAQVDQDHLRRFSGRTAARAPAADANAFIGDPQFIARGELGVTVGPIPPIPPPGAVAARPASITDPTTAGLAGEPAALAVDPARASIWITGPDGRYRIRGLTKSKLTVLAVATGFAEAKSREVSVTGGQLVTDVDILLNAGTYVLGKIGDKRGAPIIGAQISAKPEIGTPLEGFSDSDGMYRLGPVTGTVELVATAYGHVETRRTIEVPVAKGRTAAERREDIVLDAADAILAGTLDDTAGAAIAGAQIEVISGAGEGRQGATTADGTFSIDMLPRGKLRVRVSHPMYPADELEAAASSTGERARLRLPLGGQIEGVVLDGGNAIVGMMITATGPRGTTAETSTDDKGRWKLGPLRAGTWKLAIKQPGYLPQVRELDVLAASAPGVTTVRDVRIDLARGALLGGTVRNRGGQRVSGAHITVRRADGTGTPVEADTDGEGEFRIHDCPTGDLLVNATNGDAGGSTRATLRPGDEVLGLAIEIR